MKNLTLFQRFIVMYLGLVILAIIASTGWIATQGGYFDILISSLVIFLIASSIFKAITKKGLFYEYQLKKSKEMPDIELRETRIKGLEKAKEKYNEKFPATTGLLASALWGTIYFLITLASIFPPPSV